MLGGEKAVPAMLPVLVAVFGTGRSIVKIPHKNHLWSSEMIGKKTESLDYSMAPDKKPPYKNDGLGERLMMHPDPKHHLSGSQCAQSFPVKSAFSLIECTKNNPV
jgi:hypothetical protein